MSTVQPASQTTQPGFMSGMSSWWGGKEEGQALDASAAEAHRLAETLRSLNFEVYVFHTRTSSIVTIGSFDNPNDDVAQRVRQQYLTFHERQTAAWIADKKPDPLQLFPQVISMEVPRP